MNNDILKQTELLDIESCISLIESLDLGEGVAFLCRGFPAGLEKIPIL